MHSVFYFSLTYYYYYYYYYYNICEGIFHYIPETDHVSRVQFLVHVMLFHMLKILYFTLVFSEVAGRSGRAV
jgi:hypothetical protein